MVNTHYETTPPPAGQRLTVHRVWGYTGHGCFHSNHWAATGFKADPGNRRIVKKGQNKDFPVVCGHVDIKSACRQVSKGNLAHDKRWAVGAEHGIKQVSLAI